MLDLYHVMIDDVGDGIELDRGSSLDADHVRIEARTVALTLEAGSESSATLEHAELSGATGILSFGDLTLTNVSVNAADIGIDGRSTHSAIDATDVTAWASQTAVRLEETKATFQALLAESESAPAFRSTNSMPAADWRLTIADGTFAAGGAPERAAIVAITAEPKEVELDRVAITGRSSIDELDGLNVTGGTLTLTDVTTASVGDTAIRLTRTSVEEISSVAIENTRGAGLRVESLVRPDGLDKAIVLDGMSIRAQSIAIGILSSWLELNDIRVIGAHFVLAPSGPGPDTRRVTIGTDVIAFDSCAIHEDILDDVEMANALLFIDQTCN
jgi:hypothetical protein